MTFRFLSLALLVCLFGLRLSAQSSGAEPLVSTEFTIFGWAGEVTDLAYHHQGKLKAVSVPGFERSPTYKYSGSAKMEFFLNQPDAENTEKKGIKAAVASVRFEPGAKRHTVLLSGQHGQYQAWAVVDDESAFPLGRARLFNLCPMRVAVRCNRSQSIVLAPNHSELVAPRDGLLLITETAYELNGAWKRANDDFVPVPPDQQTSVFYLLSNDAYFRTIDGATRQMQMVILRERPADRESPSSAPGSAGQ